MARIVPIMLFLCKSFFTYTYHLISCPEVPSSHHQVFSL